MAPAFPPAANISRVTPPSDGGWRGIGFSIPQGRKSSARITAQSDRFVVNQNTPKSRESKRNAVRSEILYSERREVLGHSASAGLAGAAAMPNLDARRLQNRWARRDFRQPPSPEPSLGLFVFMPLSKATPAQLCQEGSRTRLQFPATSTARPTIREGLLCC